MIPKNVGACTTLTSTLSKMFTNYTLRKIFYKDKLLKYKRYNTQNTLGCSSMQLKPTIKSIQNFDQRFEYSQSVVVSLKLNRKIKKEIS